MIIICQVAYVYVPCTTEHWSTTLEWENLQSPAMKRLQEVTASGQETVWNTTHCKTTSSHILWKKKKKKKRTNYLKGLFLSVAVYMY